VPNEVVAIAIVVDGMIEAVLYVDHVPAGEPIGSVKGFELLMIEAGIGMERRVLHAKSARQSLDREVDREDAQ